MNKVYNILITSNGELLFDLYKKLENCKDNSFILYIGCDFTKTKSYEVSEKNITGISIICTDNKFSELKENIITHPNLIIDIKEINTILALSKDVHNLTEINAPKVHINEKPTVNLMDKYREVGGVPVKIKYSEEIKQREEQQNV